MLTLHSRPCTDPKVVSRPIESESVLVQPHLGKIKVVNEVGALIWQLCDGQHSVEEIVEAVCQQYGVEAQQAEIDALQFLNTLAERGLIVF
ncbi:MAG: PqqD family protein [Chloroflexota bacterium]